MNGTRSQSIRPGVWEGEVKARVEHSLMRFLPRQRWFAGKARTLKSVQLVDGTDVGQFSGGIQLVLARIFYLEGKCDIYFLPLGLSCDEKARRIETEYPAWVITRVETEGTSLVVFDALAEPMACEEILELIGTGRSIETRSGMIRGVPTQFFDSLRGPLDEPLEVTRGSAEQSNSAVSFGGRLFMKIFRRLEPGINPDLEIGRFLAERTPFRNLPRPAGSLEYNTPGEEPIVMALLQELVESQGTGWDFALNELKCCYQKIEECGDVSPPPVRTGLHPSDGHFNDLPCGLEPIFDRSLQAVATLGRRTAEMHLSLSSEPDDPKFVPELVANQDLAALAAEIRTQADATLEGLRSNLPQLAGPVAGWARHALGETPRLLAILDDLPVLRHKAIKMRLHGDYHLGQVLRTGEDFVILDFEGEPARPLISRLEKKSPVKDLVGMLRSFDYAAFAALFAHAGPRDDVQVRLTPWARAWQSWASAVFLQVYLETAAGARFLPDPASFRLLLKAFTLDKVLYELLYELNNRPDWVAIPMQGMITLIEEQR